MKGLKWGMYLHFGIYTPIFMMWIGMSIFDSEMMRKIYRWIVEFSVLGPFGGYWLALVYLFDSASENKFWDSWKLLAISTAVLFTTRSILIGELTVLH